MLAALVASLPVLFLTNVLLLYHNGGVTASITYARGALLFLPTFASYAALTFWLLTHVGMPEVLFFGIPVYLMPLVISKLLGCDVLKTKAISTKATKEVNTSW